jgi:glucokinase
VFGFASPGIVDETRGMAVFSANLGWRDLPVRQILEQRLDIEVVLSHDVRAGGVAEACFGAGRGARTVLVVPIGTGIAGALIENARPYLGAHGASVELGHIPVPGFDGPCGCGRRGCLERYASASAIAERYRQALVGAGLPSVDAEQVKSLTGTGLPGGGADVEQVLELARTGLPGEDIDAKRVQELAEGGDPLAIRIWDSAVAALGDALVVATTLLDPDRIVLAGGLSLAGPALLDPIRTRFTATPPLSGQPIEIRCAELGSQAGVIGAAHLARTRRP